MVIECVLRIFWSIQHSIRVKEKTKSKVYLRRVFDWFGLCDKMLLDFQGIQTERENKRYCILLFEKRTLSHFIDFDPFFNVLSHYIGFYLSKRNLEVSHLKLKIECDAKFKMTL